MTERMTIRPVSTFVGAEILDVDLAGSLPEPTVDAIRRALFQHGVVFFRDQKLTPEQHVAFAQRFGEININRFFKAVDGHPMIAEVRKEPEQKGNIGGGWHTDHSYDQAPAMGSILYAREVPETGGDTLFASMYAAYDALPQRLKQQLEGRVGAFTYGGRRKATTLLNAEDRDWKPVFHPIVRTHPETGRKALYFDPGKILRIEGLEASESDALIDELAGYMIQPEGQYRHTWRKGDIVIWDNRCSYHKAAGDYPPEEDRIHWRVSIKERAEGNGDRR